MKVKVIKPFEVWPGRILKVSPEIVDIDDHIAKRGIINGFLEPVEKEDIENYNYLKTKINKEKRK